VRRNIGPIEGLRTLVQECLDTAAMNASPDWRERATHLLEITQAPSPPLCNLCGLSCELVDSGLCAGELGGLIDIAVDGGYESTPGNGHGALDDTKRYRFSLCEFCLDWLFGLFVVPVRVTEYALSEGAPDRFFQDEPPWVPARERVERDEWRRFKEEFRAEAARRDAARRALDHRVTELARELESAYEQIRELSHALNVARTPQEGVWLWTGKPSEDHPPSLACPVVMSAERLRELVGRAEAMRKACIAAMWRSIPEAPFGQVREALERAEAEIRNLNAADIETLAKESP